MSKDHVLLLVLGLIGLLPLIAPIYIVEGKYPVYGYNYYQESVPVYIRLFDWVRFSYLALLLISVPVLILGLTGLAKLVDPGSDVKFALLIGYSFALLTFTGAVARVPEGHLRLSSVIGSYMVIMDVNVSKTPIGCLFIYKSIPLAFLLSIAVIGYYFADIIITTLKMREGDGCNTTTSRES